MVVSSQQIEVFNLLGGQDRFNIMSSKRNHTQMTNYSTVGTTWQLTCETEILT